MSEFLHRPKRFPIKRVGILVGSWTAGRMEFSLHIAKEIEQSDILIANAELLISEQIQAIEALRSELRSTFLAENKLRLLERESRALLDKRKIIFWRHRLLKEQGRP